MLKDYAQMTDEELIQEQNQLKRRKVLTAFVIGFLSGIVLFGIISWIMGSTKNFLSFLLPLLFPIFIIKKLLKDTDQEKNLKSILKKRGLTKK